jgi:hypothetical protein
MLDINVRDFREITFEMEISGISPSELEGRLRFTVDNIEYGIPAKITESEIKVEIPPLKRIVQRELSEGETFSARLDVYGDNHYMKPWEGEFKIKNPVLVEAKIKGEKSSNEPQIKVSVSEGGSSRAKKKLDEMKHVAESVRTTAKSRTTKKFKTVDDFKKKLTQEDVFKWLDKNGTKSDQIKEIVYEQTAGQIGSTKPYKILVELQKVYQVTKQK